jgi:multidrug efflux pump subunit AcrA (membrane-fusion protein)
VQIKFAVVISTIMALAPSSLFAQSEPIRPAKVAVVQSADATFERHYPAIVRPSMEAILSFRVSGRVTELPIRAASRVKEGDVIAQLDPRDFERQVAQLQTQRDQAVAQLTALQSGARPEEVSSIEAEIEALQAQVDQAQDQANRTRELFKKDLVAAASLEKDETALNVAEAQLRAQNQQLAIAQTGGRPEDVEAAEAALRGLDTQIKSAQDRLNDATLRAPFDGIIAQRNIDNFTNIQAGQNVVLLQRLSDVDLVFDVPGPDVTRFAQSNPVINVQLAALPDETIKAEIVEFTSQADAATQTYRGRVRINVSDKITILPGMVGTVIAAAPSGDDQNLSVPVTAIGANADGSSFVWIVDRENAVRKSTVTLGRILGDSIIVTDGVSAGDSIVAAGVTQVRDGMTIRPISKVGG